MKTAVLKQRTELKPQLLRVWKLSVPAILTQITTIAMQYIDSAMVGHLGANASASIGLVSTTTWMMGGVGTAVAAGLLCSLRNNRKRAAQRSAGRRHGLLSSLIISSLSCFSVLSLNRRCWLGGEKPCGSMRLFLFAITILF